MAAVTMKEIARLARVSRPTVSRVLNNKASLVSPETRERVLQIAQELNYHRNFQAVNLKTRKSFLVGVNFPRGLHYSESSYLTRLQYGFSLAVDETEYELVAHSSVLDREKALSLVRSNRIDGYIYVCKDSGEWFVREMASYFLEEKLPFVLVHDSSRMPMYFPNVGYNSFQAAGMAVGHLAALGHSRIGFAGPVTPGENNELLDGYRRGMLDAGLEAADNLVYPVREEYHGTGYGYLEFFFSRPMDAPERMPTAFVCSSDYYAFNLIKKLKEHSIDVPGRVAVVSARAELTRYLSTRLGLERTLTTMKQEVVSKGYEAARMLLDILDAPEGSGGSQRVIIEPKLVVRKSCGSCDANALTTNSDIRRKDHETES